MAADRAALTMPPIRTARSSGRPCGRRRRARRRSWPDRASPTWRAARAEHGDDREREQDHALVLGLHGRVQLLGLRFGAAHGPPSTTA
jgi:hypothetical protein